MSFTNAQLAQKIADLILFWSSFNEEYKNWLGGAVDGGPSSDGKFPMTDYTGVESLVDCPAKLSDNVSGYVGLASASETAAAASASAASTSESNAGTSAATATAQAVLADADRIAAELAETNAQDSAVTATAQANLAAVRAAAALVSENAASASAAAALASEVAAAASAVEAAASAATIDSGKIANWDTAYGWGDHEASDILTNLNSTVPNSTNRKFAGSYQASNQPGVSNWVSGIQFQHGVTGYASQLAMGTYSDPELWIRNFKAGSWGSWIEVLTTDNGLPLTGGELTGLLGVTGDTDVAATISATSTFPSHTNGGAAFRLRAHDGAAMGSGHRLGYLIFAGGYDSSNFGYQSLIESYATEAWSSGNRGSDLRFTVTPIGSSTRAPELIISGTGVEVIHDLTAANLNISNWDTAYGWGDHAGSYLPIGGGQLTGELQVYRSGGGANDYQHWRDTTDAADLVLRYDGSAWTFRSEGSGAGIRFMHLNNSTGAVTFDGAVTGSNLNISNWNTAYGWGNHASGGYAPTASPTFTGAAVFNQLKANDIYPTSGQHMIISAGEAISYRTGQTNEFVYVNAESGLQVNSSPDNWASGWAGRDTAVICGQGGDSTFPGDVDAATLNGYALSSSAGAAPGASQIVKTQTNGYTYLGWINTVSGNNVVDPTRIYTNGGGSDAFLRYMSPANFIDFLQGEPWDFTVTPTFAGPDTKPAALKSALSANMLHIDGKEVIDANDGWIRLNQNNDFASGVYTPYGLRVDGALTIGGVTKMVDNAAGEIRLTTASGYFEFGPKNTSWCHMYTDRANFYFNKGATMVGHFLPATDNAYDLGTGAIEWNQLFVRQIELGHPTDTSLSRYSAGKLQVEFKPIFAHVGTTYNSADITFSTSAPSGGADGDIWYEYT